MKIFKQLSEKKYTHFTCNTIEELDELPITSVDIITEFAHICEWLRVVHGIWVNADLNQFSKPDDLQWFYSIIFLKTCIYTNAKEHYNTPQEAYSAAFDYILKELI